MEKIMMIDVALLVSRVAVGAVMAAHGAQKLFGAWGGPGVEKFSGFIKSIGFVPPLVWAWIASIAEFGGGLFLILGIFPRLSAAAISATMLVAVVFVHGKSGFFASGGGYEYPFLILLVSLSLIISGAGKLSLFNKF